MTNTAAMKGLIVSRGDTQKSLAEALQLSVSAMNAKITGKSEFRVGEIQTIIDRYGLSSAEVFHIFFR